MPTNTRSALADLHAQLAAVVAALEPRAVQHPDVLQIWASFGAIERLAAAGRLALAARVKDTREWQRAGATSPAEWMANETGTTVGRARAELGTSERLDDLPLTQGELLAGNLSPEQADAITDAAAVNPNAEADLIGQAKRKGSMKGLRDEAAKRKAQCERDPEEKQRRIHRKRSVRFFTDRDGARNMVARGTVAALTEVEQVLDRMVNDRYRGPTPADPEPREAYAFDALVDLARDAANGGAGEPGPVAAAKTRPVESIKRMMLLRVDLAALVRGRPVDGELCEIPGVGPVSVEQARSMLGDSILKLVIDNGVAVQNVTHLGRGPTMAQKIALLWQHPTCFVEGCNRTVGIEHDHLIEWKSTRHTVLSELGRPCSHHHSQKTHHGFTFEPIPGTTKVRCVPPHQGDRFEDTG